MTIKRILLACAALFALAMAPAVAAPAPDIVVVAAHPGKLHVKTSLHVESPGHSCSSLTISTGVSTKVDYKKKTMLPETYYTFFDSGSFCGSDSQKVRVKLAVKKTAYARLSTGTETLTGYCSTAPTVFYGDVYDLRSRKAKGKTDTFESTLIGKDIHYNGGVYNLKVPMNVKVAIGS